MDAARGPDGDAEPWAEAWALLPDGPEARRLLPSAELSLGHSQSAWASVASRPPLWFVPAPARMWKCVRWGNLSECQSELQPGFSVPVPPQGMQLPVHFPVWWAAAEMTMWVPSEVKVSGTFNKCREQADLGGACSPPLS